MQKQLDKLDSKKLTAQQQTKLSNIIYALGDNSQDLLFFIENTEKLEKQTQENMSSLKSQQFLHLQKTRTQKITSVFQKFFMEYILDKEKDSGIKEVASIIKKEICALLDNYDRYVGIIEDNISKLKLF